MADSRSVIPAERIERSILLIRGENVMLDSDLAELYGVETRALVQAVQRNRERFPDDFMFQLSREEFDNLRSQSVISSSGWGGRRYPPYAFTEQGVAMLSSVLRSQRAVQVNIEIMRAFVRLREMVASHRDLARRASTSWRSATTPSLRPSSDVIRQLMAPPAQPRRRLGFRVGEEEDKA